MEKIYLAIDIGASSGRHMIIIKQDDIFIDEIYRFNHDSYEENGYLYWSHKKLFEEVKKGIKIAIKKYPKLKSIGIDTWGVDYTFIDKNGNILRDPISYRDNRGLTVSDKLHQIISADDLYQMSGIQFMHFNTIYQLYHDTLYFPEDIKKAYKMVMIPDLIGYYLTKEIAMEYTNFSTTNLMDVKTGEPIEVIEKLNIPKHIFPNIVKPGNFLGYLDVFKSSDLKHKEIKVFNVCSHDTASAYASIKQEKGVAVLNVGTWSLLGANVDEPILNQSAKNNNFTNEAGIQGTRFLKNIMGMWIVNHLKDKWETEGHKLTFKNLEKKALLSEPYRCFIDPDEQIFHQSNDMVKNIQDYCIRTKQNPPETIGQIMRCVYESLAFKYRYVLEKMEETIGYPIHKIVMLGGGSRSDMLNELTAKVTERSIFIGPAEATTLGNGIVQMLANKDVADLSEIQDCISKHFLEIKREKLEDEDVEAYQRFLKIIKGEI